MSITTWKLASTFIFSAAVSWCVCQVSPCCLRPSSTNGIVKRGFPDVRKKLSDRPKDISLNFVHNITIWIQSTVLTVMDCSSEAFSKRSRPGLSSSANYAEACRRTEPNPIVLALTVRVIGGRSVCLCFDLASLAVCAIHIGHQVGFLSFRLYTVQSVFRACCHSVSECRTPS